MTAMQEDLTDSQVRQFINHLHPNPVGKGLTTAWMEENAPWCNGNAGQLSSELVAAGRVERKKGIPPLRFID